MLACLGLAFTALQFGRARKAACLQALQQFSKDANEREAALAGSRPENQEHAFVEFLNFLEIYSAAENSRLLTGTAREIVRDKLIDSLCILEKYTHWHPIIENAVITKNNLKHVKLFMSRNRRLLHLCRKEIRADNRLSPV